MVKTMLSLLRARVQFPVGKPGSHNPQGAAKINKSSKA